MPVPALVSIPLLGCSDPAIMQAICSLGLMATAFDVDAELTGAQCADCIDECPCSHHTR